MMTVKKSNVLVNIEAMVKAKQTHQKKQDKAEVELKEYFLKKKWY